MRSVYIYEYFLIEYINKDKTYVGVKLIQGILSVIV